MYYEAKSVNTHLIYRYKQLEQIKATLQAAWTAHKQLHQAVGHVLEDGSSLSRPRYVFSSSVCHPAACAARELALCQSLSQSQTELDAVARCPTAVTMSQVCSVGDLFYCRASNDPPPTVVRHGFTSFACEPEQNSDFAIGDRQLTFPGKSLSVLDCIDDVNGHRQTSAVFDADQPGSASHLWSMDDDASLESLFGTDDWWSADESWQWQCGT